MKLDGIISGKYSDLRSVDFDDAEFIVSIRNDTEKNKFVHAVSKDIELQKNWIENQIAREGDYYFVICDKSQRQIGLVSIYDVNKNPGGAEFGRWISWGNAVQNVESVILAFDFAFEKLGVDYLYMRTMRENLKVRSFWKRFGAAEVGIVYEDDLWLDKTIVKKIDYYNELRQKNTKLLKY